MKLTLLGVVQSYLNKTSGFYVNSIFDTDESQQVAQIAEEVYYSLVQRFRDWEFTTTVTTLDSVSDTTKPNYLQIPSNVQRLKDCTLEYNNSTDDVSVRYTRVEYLPPELFLKQVNKHNVRADNAEVVEDHNGTKFVIVNNKYPEYYTSFDGKYVVFDSYHSSYETTLQASKSRVVLTSEPVFLQADDFVIPVPEHMSELYRDMVIAECYEHLLQQPAPPSTTRRVATRAATAQQHERKTGSMNKRKRIYGR